jgi:hypothetical protein
MEDMVLSSRAFLEFDFSAFIDNNFDTSSELFNSSASAQSPTVLSPATIPALDDFLSQSDTGSVGSNTVPSNTSISHSSQQSSYCTDENASLNISDALLLQNDLFTSQHHKTPPSLSCIDTFIQNPDSDLVQLVQQNKDEFHVFQGLISSSLSNRLSVTPPEKSHNQKKRKSPAVQNPSPNKKSYTKGLHSYENSDDVNAQLLRELIKQTTNKRNHPNKEFPAPMDYSPPNEMTQFGLPKNPSGTHGGQEQQIYHARRYCGSNPDPQIPNSKRHNVPPVPYHIQTTAPKKVTKTEVYHRRPSSMNNRPSMYSSDINPAQLLEIQAISRAQQDFIRAREQQEAEKELFLKLQKKA